MANSRVRTKTGADLQLAYALLRLTLGVNIAMHGISRIATGLSPFAAGMLRQFAGTRLPAPIVFAFAYLLPWVEALAGLLVLLGAATRIALIAGSLVITALMFGACLRQDWETAGLQLTYAVAYFILLGLRRYNRFSMDAVFSGARESRNRPPISE